MTMAKGNSENLVIVVEKGIEPFTCDREQVEICLEIIRTSKEVKRG